ncbi:MAG TPA: hypothetical protein VFR11_22270 [Micromonosporaceae bacterium]|jgi:hypothetical protein|nr:hypothetical protein [Micromonosporaceae bacterium]
MADGRSAAAPRPDARRSRWNSFVAVAPAASGKSRALNEEGHPTHRVRVEYDGDTVLVHLSDEDGRGWTTIAVDRATREWSVAQRDNQRDAASAAYTALYEP